MWNRRIPEASIERIAEMLITEAANILSIDRYSVGVDTPFHSSGMNSLAFVELLVVIEQTLDLRLMETELRKEESQTLGPLAPWICKMQ